MFQLGGQSPPIGSKNVNTGRAMPAQYLSQGKVMIRVEGKVMIRVGVRL
jgi:hypothetical protein